MTATRTTTLAEPQPPRLLAVPNLPLLVGLPAFFLLIAYVASAGLTLPILGLAGACVFVAVVAAFVAVPWVALPAAIVVFTMLPTVRAFTSTAVGGTKDLVSVAALVAAVVVVVQRRAERRSTQLDIPLLVLFALLLALYLGNIGGGLTGETGHGVNWFQGIRLMFEPLALLFVGLSAKEPRRTFVAAAKATVWSGVVVALYGLFQQYLGINRLVALGYTYGAEVRQIGPRLRSFGTLGEPFSYAAYLLLVLALVLLWSRRGRARNALIALLVLGLLVSYVRTAAVIGLALIGVALARRGRTRLAIMLVLIAATLGALTLLAASDKSSTRTVVVSPTTYLTLNGRTKVWDQVLGSSPTRWIFGRGVAAVGTAADRAQRSLLGKAQLNPSKQAVVVDSSYLALMADVGLLGLLLMLALFVRLAMLGRRAVTRGDPIGWAALGLLTVVVLDALSRESFTGFPNAYVAYLLLGLACAATAAPPPGSSRA